MNSIHWSIKKTKLATSTRRESHVKWLWKSGDNIWCNYSDIETEIIEESYKRNESIVALDNYHIDFEHFIQISNNNSNKQRAIKRVVDDNEQVKLREERFLPNPIVPAAPFADLDSNNFVKAVRDHFNLNQLHLNDDAERKFLVQKAVEGLITEGKKTGRQKEGEWLAQQLHCVENGTREEVWQCCARLYCIQSFLYLKMNEWMRIINDQQQQHIWQSKIDTFGPFACLLFKPSGNERNKTFNVYRGAYLSEELIEHYRSKCTKTNEEFLFPAFTSTSRNQAKAEQFGNVLFVIEISDYDSYDVSPYSAFDEEEQLIKPSFTFYIRSCQFNENKNKWIIHLKSFLST